MGFLNKEAGIECTSNIMTSYGDSIDIAFLALAKKAKVDSELEIIGRIPYESENKYSAVFYQNDGFNVTTKGAVDTILEFCNMMYRIPRVLYT